MKAEGNDRRYPAPALRAFTERLFEAEGMQADKAAAVADILVEADMLGHLTHGLALVPRYIEQIEAGVMAKAGEIEVIGDRGACVTWNGRNLPGIWLATKAIELGMARAPQHGIASVAIGRCHHIGALAAYLPRVTERGFMLFIASSAPGASAVAPFGGLRAALSPAPIAAGVPTQGDPIMIDISGSITTMNMASQLGQEGGRFPGQWLMDAEGNPSDDPAVLEQGGSLLPAGGVDHGQKGYGWGLIAESLSQGLSGFGRADHPKGMFNSVLVQVIDPNAFAGLDIFLRQTSAIAAACLASPPRPGFSEVRLPGGNALRRRQDASAHGVPLRSLIVEGLEAAAAPHGIPLPAALPQHQA